MTTEHCRTNDQMERSLIDIAVESWRFSRLFSRVVNKLDVGEAGRYVNQLRYFQKKVEESLDDAGLKFINAEGQPFDPGMEPIIMGSDGLRKQGTVMLKKVEV